MEFAFEKPEGYKFVAGQYFYVTLINPTDNDAEGDTRIFSIIPAPHEDYLAFSTRMRDTAFKRVMKNMNVGDKVKIEAPIGWFTLHSEPERPTIFLVGGIGIAPFISILRSAIQTKAPHKMYLFYSNRRPEDTAYLGELQEMAKNNPNIVFISTMTDMSKSAQPWTGETSMINMDLVKKYVPDISNAIYYIAGPQPMVRAMRTLFNDLKIPSVNVKAEEFTGY